MPPVVRTSNASRGEVDDGSRDQLGLVGYHPPHHVEAFLSQQLLQQHAARVLALARVYAVGDGEHRCLQVDSFVFSTSCTFPTTIVLSIAFAMS